MTRRDYAKPDGTVTSDSRAYVDAWEEFYAPIEKALGVRVWGFDPSLTLINRESPSESVQIPLWLAKRIRGLIVPAVIHPEVTIEEP